MTMHILSLGAGVQSTTMALMAAHGEIEPMPACAIFADTGWEPKAVYKHLEWLTSGVLPFPVHIVSAGNIRDDLMARYSKRGRGFINIPAHVELPDGSHTIGKRQCTSHYKIEPMRKKTRELIGKPTGTPPVGAATKWIGISVDEVFRATPSKVKFEVHRFPLLEARMSRGDCIEWLKRHNYALPGKSACIGCPLRSMADWRLVKANPDEWRDAVEVDAAIRSFTTGVDEQFLHPHCKPLDQVDLSTAEDRGQLNMFNHECEGMCGV